MGLLYSWKCMGHQAGCVVFLAFVASWLGRLQDQMWKDVYRIAPRKQAEERALAVCKCHHEIAGIWYHLTPMIGGLHALCSPVHLTAVWSAAAHSTGYHASCPVPLFIVQTALIELHYCSSSTSDPVSTLDSAMLRYVMQCGQVRSGPTWVSGSSF